MIHLGVLCAFALGLLLVYGPMLRHELVRYDTESLILENYFLRGAPTGDFIRWAFTTNYGGYWMPLTWVTHRLDVQLHGYQPWGHLLTNLLIHSANVFLLFLVLRRMTGTFWRSAAVAAIFAFHPMRAESVAWVAERKDILSSFFWMVTLLAYERYTRGSFVWWRYLLVVLGQALALLCKPSVVTLPFALLLLDYWPLRRWPSRLQNEGKKERLRQELPCKQGKARELYSSGIAKPEAREADLSEIKNARNIIGRVFDEATTNPGVSKKAVTFASVSDDQAQEIFNSTGLDVAGFHHAIGNGEILKILKDHGASTETLRGQFPVTREIFLELPQVVLKPDLIESAGQTKQGLEAIRFVKRINGNMVVVDEIRSGRGMLVPKTLYVGKAGAKHAPGGESGPATETPEALPGLPEDIIPPAKKPVKAEEYQPLSSFKSQISNSPSQFRIPHSAFRILLEKTPLLLLICVISIMTYRSQRELHIMAEMPLSLRLANVPVHYLAYLSKSFFPVSLSVLYPHARAFPAPLHLAAALVLLGTVSAAALRGWRRRPYFFAGWFWFLGVLLPMVGVVQVFIAAIANRYTYLSQIGLAICAVWGAAELAARFEVPRRAMAALAAAALAVLIILDIRQVATWQDDVTLWTHAVAATARNDYAWNNLGNAYAVRGDHARTRECYRKALELNPSEAMYHLNYGRVMEQAGDTTTALAHYQAAVTAKPEDVQARIRTGEALLTLKRADEALAQFDAALARDARNARLYADRGAAWALKGALERAAADDRQALALDPNCIRAHYDLGLLAAGRQDFKSAVESFSTAARLQPAAAEPRVQLGQVYAAMGDKTRGAENFRAAQDLARRAGNTALEQKAANFLRKL